MKKNKKIFLFCMMAILGIIFLTLAKQLIIDKEIYNIKLNPTKENSDSTIVADRIHFLKTGNSDAILIESNGHFGLVDTAFSSDSTRPESEGAYHVSNNGIRVKNYIKKVMGDKKLDFIVLTHSHADHVGGAPDLAECVDSKTIVFYKQYEYIKNEEEGTYVWNNIYYFNLAISSFQQAGAVMCDVSGENLNTPFTNITSNNSSITNIVYNDGTYEESNTNVDDTIYFKMENYEINLYNLHHISDEEENTNSIITLVKKGNQKIALMGDQEARIRPATGDSTLGVESQIANVIGKITLLKAGHHGGFSSNSLYMMNKFNPDNVVITTIWADTISEPFELEAALLNKRGAKVYITGNSSGAIVAEINDDSINYLDYTLDFSKVGDAINCATNTTPGWHTTRVTNFDDRAWIYIDEGNILTTGWKKINDKWYFLDEDGIMKTGWVKSGAFWYYLNEEQTTEHKLGEMLTGWQQVAGKWYYLCQEDNEVEGHFEGSMVKGWHKLEFGNTNFWYFFVEHDGDYEGFITGEMLTGRHLVEFNGVKKYYYFCEERDNPQGYYKGAMISNTTYNGYYYDESGAWVDNIAPNITITYSNKELTKEDVVVTIEADEEIQEIEGWTISENKKVLTKTYSKNTDENIIIKDLYGNQTIQKVEIKNIDKKPPTITIDYSEIESTGEYIVTLNANEEVQSIEGWTISENRKTLTKLYSENTDEEGDLYTIKDLIGNETQVKIIVRNIVKVNIESDKYEISDMTIKNINNKTTVSNMLSNMTIIADEIKVFNSNNEVIQGDKIVGTGMKIVLNNKFEYKLIITGDLDGDGVVGIQDLLMVNKHRLGKNLLLGIYFEAGDVNEDNTVDIKDLLQINKARLGKIVL